MLVLFSSFRCLNANVPLKSSLSLLLFFYEHLSCGAVFLFYFIFLSSHLAFTDVGPQHHTAQCCRSGQFAETDGALSLRTY